MVEPLLVGAGLLVVTALALLSITTIKYHVTAKHLKVTWLGVPVRHIRLDDIRHITTKPVFWAERWYNTFVVKNRMLVIRRRSGLCKNFIITPKSPFVFRAELERQRKEHGGAGSDPRTPTHANPDPLANTPHTAKQALRTSS
jgi:hypothetical protein